MTRGIHPLQPDEVGELGRFLAEGFGASGEMGPHSPEVLLWKYFDTRGHEAFPRSFVVRERGVIVGHVGLCPTAFVVGPGPGGEVPTLHMIDWLGSGGHPGVGLSLMRHVQRLTPTQYVCGGSAAARRVLDAARYERPGDVPVFRKVLRVGYRLRASERMSARTLAGAARDATRIALGRGPVPERRVEIRRVAAFGHEVEALVNSLGTSAISTGRWPGLLNHFLRHPSGSLGGHLILEAGEVRGFALLNVLLRGRSRIGKIVECFLDDRSAALGQAAIAALVESLRERGADVALGCGSTPWAAEAYRAYGFDEVYRLEFRLRDPAGLVPRGGTFHITFLEADYSYLP